MNTRFTIEEENIVAIYAEDSRNRRSPTPRGTNRSDKQKDGQATNLTVLCNA